MGNQLQLFSVLLIKICVNCIILFFIRVCSLQCAFLQCVHNNNNNMKKQNENGINEARLETITWFTCVHRKTKTEAIIITKMWRLLTLLLHIVVNANKNPTRKFINNDDNNTHNKNRGKRPKANIKYKKYNIKLFYLVGGVVQLIHLTG